ncbi:transcriptional activator NhaR [Myxococcota bacterium]|nr:transcriptional activator NhaR [Myxococcota bacterium]
MEWLNYHHLLYFWTIARTGSVSAAAAELRLAQPTLSGQLRVLEDQLEKKLFERSGRRLVLTDVGREVYRYADEIFALGRELMDTVRGRPTGQARRLLVGVADVVPKLVAFRLLEPALRLAEPVRLVCREDDSDRLMADLAVQALDLVISDAPIAPSLKVRAFSHLLGESGISFFAAPGLANAHRRGFPASLNGAPMLLPVDSTMLRRSLDRWFDAQAIRPQIVSEFEDSALLKAFGHAGVGIFPGPTIIEAQIRRQYGVTVVGRTDAVTERFYAITVDRKIKDPAIAAISEAAREKLFR